MISPKGTSCLFIINIHKKIADLKHLSHVAALYLFFTVRMDFYCFIT